MDKLARIRILFHKEAAAEIGQMVLVVGLGNPGRQYQSNRHNVGFLLVDQLAERLGVKFTRLQSKALVTRSSFGEHTVLLAKPQTYMNLSGQAVASLINYYKVTHDQVMIVYDDVDLPFGAIRIRPSGGSGGHNGMNSIIEKLGTNEFPRLRVGIGRPPGRMDAAAYVLQDFDKNENQELRFLLDRAVEAILTFISEGLQPAMNKFNAPELI